MPALLSALAALTLAFAGVYLYAESLKTPSIVVSRTPPPTQPQSATSRPLYQPSARLGPPSAVGESEPQRDEVVRALAWLAKTSLKEGRLTAPPADNAHYYYSRLLALDPLDERAQAGIAAIAERYVVLAEKDFVREDIAAAQAHIKAGLQVQPHNEGLLKLREIIASRDQSALETILEFVRGRE